MATLPFEPKVAGDSSNSVTPRTLKIDFGDGYNQRAADGINTNPEVWQLKWDLTGTNATTLIAFFKTHGGHTSFDWTPPRETTSQKFIVNEWNVVPYGEQGAVITATIEQVYDT